MRSLLLVCFLGLTFSIHAQQVNFKARTSANRVFEGSFVTVDFELENADGSNFIPPTFDGFALTSGLSRSSSTTIINGKMSSSTTFSYELSPQKVGNLIIGPASIEVNGRKLTTKPLRITVLKADPNQKKKQAENVFIELRVSDSLTHVGQQITLEYVLYTKVDIRAQKYLEQPEYDGFFVENLRVSRSSFKTDIINGSEYYYKVIDRVALFPQQTGNYTFGPVRFRLGAATEGERTGFFFNQKLKYFIVESNSINIQVSDFRSNVPFSFSGAVGKYEMSLSVPKNKISQDDAFTFLMQVKGDGDSRTVNPPNQTFGDDLDNYDPNTISEDSYVSGGRIMNEKTFEYIAVPKRTGEFIVQPEFTYFDIDSSTFVTLKSDSIQFFVSPGTGISRIQTDERISKKELNSFVAIDKVKKRTPPFFRSTFFWIICSLIFAAFIGVFYRYWQMIQDGKIDPKIKKANAAKQIALRRLSRADELIRNGQNKEAFAEISKSFKEYLSDKWSIDYSTLNTKSIIDLLTVKNIKTETIDKTRFCLDQSEMAIYAGANPKTLADVRQKMGEIIEHLEA